MIEWIKKIFSKKQIPAPELNPNDSTRGQPLMSLWKIIASIFIKKSESGIIPDWECKYCKHGNFDNFFFECWSHSKAKTLGQIFAPVEIKSAPKECRFFESIWN